MGVGVSEVQGQGLIHETLSQKKKSCQLEVLGTSLASVCKCLPSPGFYSSTLNVVWWTRLSSQYWESEEGR